MRHVLNHTLFGAGGGRRGDAYVYLTVRRFKEVQETDYIEEFSSFAHRFSNNRKTCCAVRFEQSPLVQEDAERASRAREGTHHLYMRPRNKVELSQPTLGCGDKDPRTHPTKKRKRKDPRTHAGAGTGHHARTPKKDNQKTYSHTQAQGQETSRAPQKGQCTTHHTIRAKSNQNPTIHQTTKKYKTIKKTRPKSGREGKRP